MKTVGLSLLFGLCCLIGFRIAAGKTERLRTIRALRGDLQMLSERIASGRGSLMKIASERKELLAGSLSRYLEALSEGKTEEVSAERAAAVFRKGSAEAEGMRMFFSGLSAAGRSEFTARTDSLLPMLKRAEEEAEAEAKQAQVIRVSGALIGAAIAILLL
jgi:stage III sporulation protein AB